MTAHDRIGLGWRAPLAAGIFMHMDAIDVVEVIADDLFEVANRELNAVRSLAREVPMVVHGVALGLASVMPVQQGRLDRLARVVNALEPTMWSEHMAFVRGGRYEIGHLAAPPRNSLTVEGAVRNIARIRTVVGEQPVLENIATLIDPPDSTLSEAEWVRSIAAESNSPLLLDLHNLYANAANFGSRDPVACLREFPLERVSSVHISGGQWVQLDSSEHNLTARRLLDDHVHDVPDVVFTMLAELGRLCPQPLTVILERDGQYPEFPLLLKQLRRAREALAQGRLQNSDFRLAAHRLNRSFPGRRESVAQAAPAHIPGLPLTGQPVRRMRRTPVGFEQNIHVLHAPGKTYSIDAPLSNGSARQFEAFLARLYCDRDFLEEFMREPDRVIEEARLTERERQAAIAIDRTGLLMAARSFESKRRTRKPRPSTREKISGFLNRLRG